MLVGVPKETKIHEYRVGLTPESAQKLTQQGHSVLVESQAGQGINASDDLYQQCGATIVFSPNDIFDRCELIVKVKEPSEEEARKLRPCSTLLTYLHLASNQTLTEQLMYRGCTAIAYETVTSPTGGLPLLAPMSIIAGRMATQVGAHYLQHPQGGRGILMSGLEGAPPAKVVILGAGSVGTNAARIAEGMRAIVYVLDTSETALYDLQFKVGLNVYRIKSTPEVVAKHITQADLVIGGVLVPGARAPKVISEQLVSSMKHGSVIVDVAIDQGGCIETSYPTTHAEPTYVKHSVIHYCVTNMPGAVPHTSTYALNHVTINYILELASKGIDTAIKENEHLASGVNTYKGQLTHKGVADAFSMQYADIQTLI